MQVAESVAPPPYPPWARWFGRLPYVAVATPAATAVALAALTLAVIGIFDVVGPRLAFNDDWVYAWSVAHYPRIYPSASALAIPQVTWARLFTFASSDARLLRLSILPFAAVSALLVFRLSRRLGADANASALAALALVAFPVFSADATTFMSDVPYLALELGTLYAAMRWIEEPRWGWLLLGLTVLATLQRQVGVMLPFAYASALFHSPQRRSRRHWLVVTAALAASLAALALVSLAGLAPPTQGNRLTAAHTLDINALAALMILPANIGFGLAVMLPMLARRNDGRGQTARWHKRLGFAVLAWGIGTAALTGTMLVGNVFSPLGLNWTYLGGAKPVVYPLPVFAALGLAGLAATVALIYRLPAAAGFRFDFSSLLLLAAAFVQFAPVLLDHYPPIDRYFLPVVAALLPLAARAASGASPRRAWLGVAVAGALVVAYSIGEQDYQAFQVARDAAARAAYARAGSPYVVHAGYEANGVYGEIPAYNRSGVTLSGLAKAHAYDFSLEGPRDPLLRLLVVPAADPRPGFAYASIAPGKVIIVPGDVSR